VEENRRGGGRGGPATSQAVGGERLIMWGGGKLGAWAAARGMRGGGRAPARPEAGRRRLRSVSGDREREGGREEAGVWASPWDGSHLSAKQGERERDRQVGPAAI
jgi:hypothetical protein